MVTVLGAAAFGWECVELFCYCLASQACIYEVLVYVLMIFWKLFNVLQTTRIENNFFLIISYSYSYELLVDDLYFFNAAPL